MKSAKNMVMLIGLFAAFSASAQSNSEWFLKVSDHIDHGEYLGKLDGLKLCNLTIGRSDKKGILVTIESTRLFDVFGRHDKVLADMHVLPTDKLTGSRNYAQPFESKDVLTFGYNEEDGKHSALIIKTLSNGKIDVTIETDKNGKPVDSVTCRVSKK